MLDRDLAALYGVETKRLKEAVKRNMTRFPDDFMFEMTTEELADWRTQFATSNSELKGLRHTPYCFTEQGVTMLSCILNSSRAIQVNIRIIRTFVKMRDLFAINADLQLQLQQLERKVDANDTEIRTLLDLIHHYLSLHEQPRNPIGFKYGL